MNKNILEVITATIAAQAAEIERLREAVETLLAEARERGGSVSNGERLGCTALTGAS